MGADGMLKFYDVRSKSLAGELKLGGDCFTLAWSPDGTELLVGKKVVKAFLDTFSFQIGVWLTIGRWTE